MKKISLSEFRDYYMSNHFTQIIFASDNQIWHNIESSLHISLAFDKMTFQFNPNVICCARGNDVLKLNRVKSVIIPDEQSLLGQIFIVVCADKSGCREEKEYTLVVR